MSTMYTNTTPNKCPVCSAPREQMTWTTVGEEAARSMFHGNCHACDSRVLVFMIKNNMGIMTVGVLTDVTVEELPVVLERQAIAPDDVVAVHDYLRNFSGRTRDLFVQ